MKLTFIVPPCYDHHQPAERSAGCTRVVYPMPNIYELTVAAGLRDGAGHEVAYRDFVFNRHSADDFERFVADDRSEAYLIWAVNLSIESDLQAISVVRRYHSATPVIMMGPGPTYYSRKCLVDDNVYVVRGEPEATLPQLIEAIRMGRTPEAVRGVSWLGEDGKVVNNAPRPLLDDYNQLPFAARHLLGDAVYHNPKLKTGPYTTMITSRNCPYKCIYCVPLSLTFAREIEFRREHQRKPTIGLRSPENVEAEVKMRAEQGYKAIGFMDDNFIWNEQRNAAICDIMQRYGMVWGCQARADAITEPIAKKLSESGCLYVDLGVESFNEEILKYIHKNETADDIRRAVALLKKYRVPVKLNVLIGSSPLETRDTVLDTLRETKNLGVDQVMFNIVSP